MADELEPMVDHYEALALGLARLRLSPHQPPQVLRTTTGASHLGLLHLVDCPSVPSLPMVSVVAVARHMHAEPRDAHVSGAVHRPVSLARAG